MASRVERGLLAGLDGSSYASRQSGGQQLTGLAATLQDQVTTALYSFFYALGRARVVARNHFDARLAALVAFIDLLQMAVLPVLYEFSFADGWPTAMLAAVLLRDPSPEAVHGTSASAFWCIVVGMNLLTAFTVAAVHSDLQYRERPWLLRIVRLGCILSPAVNAPILLTILPTLNCESVLEGARAASVRAAGYQCYGDSGIVYIVFTAITCALVVPGLFFVALFFVTFIPSRSTPLSQRLSPLPALHISCKFGLVLCAVFLRGNPVPRGALQFVLALAPLAAHLYYVPLYGLVPLAAVGGMRGVVALAGVVPLLGSALGLSTRGALGPAFAGAILVAFALGAGLSVLRVRWCARAGRAALDPERGGALEPFSGSGSRRRSTIEVDGRDDGDGGGGDSPAHRRRLPLRRPFEAEVAARALLGAPERHLAPAHALFLLAIEEYPASAELYLSFAIFLSHYRQNAALHAAYLQKAVQARSGFLMSFACYCLDRLRKESGDGLLIEVQQMMQLARIYEVRAKLRIRRFWELLLSASVSLADLPNVVTHVERAKEKAARVYETLLLRQPKNGRVLRRYARFCHELLGDDDAALRFLVLAEEAHEAAQLQAPVYPRYRPNRHASLVSATTGSAPEVAQGQRAAAPSRGKVVPLGGATDGGPIARESAHGQTSLSRRRRASVSIAEGSCKGGAAAVTLYPVSSASAEGGSGSVAVEERRASFVDDREREPPAAAAAAAAAAARRGRRATRASLPSADGAGAGGGALAGVGERSVEGSVTLSGTNGVAWDISPHDRMRRRMYRERVASARSRPLLWLYGAVLLTLAVLLTDVVVFYAMARTTLADYSRALEATTSPPHAALAAVTASAAASSLRWAAAQGWDTTPYAAKLVASADTLDSVANRMYHERGRLGASWGTGPVAALWETYAIPMHGYVGPSGEARTTSMPLLDAAATLARAARDLAAAPASELASDPPPLSYLLLVENGNRSVAGAFQSMTSVLQDVVNDRITVFRNVAVGVFLGTFLVVLLSAAFLFRPAFEAIEEERRGTLRLFLEIPRPTIEGILASYTSSAERSVGRSASRERPEKDAEAEAAAAAVAAAGKMGALGDPGSSNRGSVSGHSATSMLKAAAAAAHEDGASEVERPALALQAQAQADAEGSDNEEGNVNLHQEVAAAEGFDLGRSVGSITSRLVWRLGASVGVLVAVPAALFAICATIFVMSRGGADRQAVVTSQLVWKAARVLFQADSFAATASRAAQSALASFAEELAAAWAAVKFGSPALGTSGLGPSSAASSFAFRTPCSFAWAANAPYASALALWTDAAGAEAVAARGGAPCATLDAAALAFLEDARQVAWSARPVDRLGDRSLARMRAALGWPQALAQAGAPPASAPPLAGSKLPAGGASLPVLFDQLVLHEMESGFAFDGANTALSALFGLYFPVLLVVFFAMIRPLVRTLQAENTKSSKMLLMIPLDVIEAVPAIKEFLTSGRRADVREMLAESKAQSRSILQAAEDSVIVADDGGLVTIFNPSAERLFARRATDVVGKVHVTELLPDFQSAAERRRASAVEIARRASGTAFPPAAAMGGSRPHLSGSGLRRRSRRRSAPGDAEDAEPMTPAGEHRGRAFAVRPDGTRVPVQISTGEGSVAGSTFQVLFVRDISDRLRYEETIKAEKKRSDELLYSILPQSICERLKRGEKTIADEYDNASVLFSDIVGFTTLASRMTPQEVVFFLNRMFSVFDEINERCAELSCPLHGANLRHGLQTGPDKTARVHGQTSPPPHLGLRRASH
eukprot:tig00020943_g16296.t1